MPKISALPPNTAAAADDEFPGVDDSTGATKKYSLTAIKEWLQSLSGWVTNSMLASGTGEPGGAWTTWAPSWTNVTVGSGTQVARYIKVGKTIRAEVNLIYGSGSSFGDAISVSLPVAAASRYGSMLFQSVGSAVAGDAGVNGYTGAVIIHSSTSTALIRWNASTAQYTTIFPFSEGTGDSISISFEYECA